jgi:hypothetical protein
MSDDTDPMDTTGSSNVDRPPRAIVGQPCFVCPDLERSLLIPNNFTRHYQQVGRTGVMTVNSQDPSQLNDVVHHATAAYSRLSDAHADQTVAHYKLQSAYISKSMKCDHWRTLYEPSLGTDPAAMAPVQQTSNFLPKLRPIQVDIGTLHLNILSNALPLCIPGIPISATAALTSGSFAPSSYGEKIPRAPKYRQMCTRDPNTDIRRGCNYLHAEWYAHLIPDLPYSADSETGPNDGDMGM